ncbi:hypothetical protein BS47DRAFT_1336224 [Hydnum rufescens UP504]|uniref:Uncharacterized protein n=1 Tax=Hydnum rufescens UP504 TaxID=1448309 RepID=A0A9P6BA32_9AGAM|nr:hypothetical protein BS47DRAFT_1336224 [Hydnum rufescens UP504]
MDVDAALHEYGAPTEQASLSQHAPQGGLSLSLAYKLSTPPPMGYPPVHSWVKATLFSNLHDNTRAIWDAYAGPKIIAMIWNAGYNQPNYASTLMHLKNAIKEAAPGSNPCIGPPTPKEPPKDPCASPWGFLVADLSPLDAAMLTNQCTWSCDAISFFAIPYKPDILTFVGTVMNLIGYDSSDSTEVTKLVQDKLCEPGPAHYLLMDLAPGNDPLVRSTIDSLEAHPLELLGVGGVPQCAWNIYATPPFSDLTYHYCWCKAFSNCTFPTAFNGTGTVHCLAHFSCLGCKSVDHPSGLCPYSSIQGWKGTPLAAPSRATTAVVNINDATTSFNSLPRGTSRG